MERGGIGNERTDQNAGSPARTSEMNLKWHVKSPRTGLGEVKSEHQILRCAQDFACGLLLGDPEKPAACYTRLRSLLVGVQAGTGLLFHLFDGKNFASKSG